MGWPIFHEMVTANRLRVVRIPRLLFFQIIIVAHIPRVADISENLRWWFPYEEGSTDKFVIS